MPNYSLDLIFPPRDNVLAIVFVVVGMYMGLISKELLKNVRTGVTVAYFGISPNTIFKILPGAITRKKVDEMHRNIVGTSNLGPTETLVIGLVFGVAAVVLISGLFIEIRG